MTTAFAQQLRQIAAKSTNELDLRSRREAHAESLIFERNIAVKQDWETLYQICIEGFQELCLLDGRFKDFERNLFALSSKDQDREQLNKSQNEGLDGVVEQCLQALGSRLTLRPGIKALEWLVRRFRIHVYNTGALLLTVLPYHEAQLSQNILSIVPTQKLIDEWKFLRPYHQNPSLVPRHTIVYTATTNDGFFLTLNRYALDCCQNGASNPVFIRFWSSVVVEAVGARLRQAQSGRKEIQKQRTEDALLKVLPLLDEGLNSENAPDMTIACFAIVLVVASTGLLRDDMMDSLMLSIARTLSFQSTDLTQALVCVSILAAQKEDIRVPGRVVNIIAKLDDPVSQLRMVKRQYSLGRFLHGVVRGALVTMKQKDMELRLSLIEKILKAGRSLCEESDMMQMLIATVSHLQRFDEQGSFASAVSSRIRAMLQDLHDSADFGSTFYQLAELCKLQGIDLESILEATITEGETSTPGIDHMEVDEQPQDEADLDSLIAALPTALEEPEGFVVTGVPSSFGPLLELLSHCSKLEDGQTQFATLELWQSTEQSQQLCISFLVRVACGHYPPSLRIFAISFLANHLNKNFRTDYEALLPYATVLLADSSSALRRHAANLILAMENGVNTHTAKGDSKEHYQLQSYPQGTSVHQLEPLQLDKILKQVYLPYLEECVADSDQIHSILLQALNGSSAQVKSPSKQVNVEIKKTLRHSLFESLTSHALATSLLRFRLRIIELLDGVVKVSPTTKNEALNPILREWISLSPDASRRWAHAEELKLSIVDGAVARLITARDRELMTGVVKTVEEQKLSPRPELITSLFERVAGTWNDQKPDGQQSLAIMLFNLSFAGDSLFARGARATLKKVSLSNAALQAMLEDSLASAETRANVPSPSKKRKLGQDEKDTTPTPASAHPAQGISRVVLALELVDGSAPESRPELMPGLFDVLILLRRLRGPTQSESPYALGLCLNSLLAIIDQAKEARKTQLDLSSIRADVVIECVRNAESPQVQSDALMLSASLAELAPDRVIHHIMPVFTFMGSNMMSMDDGHSVNVVNQAIDRIIPPLVGKLKQQDEHNLIRSTTGLLSSFVAAFDHIPQHRRSKLYQRLLKRLGPEDFGFALSAMLTNTKPAHTSRNDFLVNVMGDFTPLEQLVTYSKIISLVSDIYSDKPHDADSLLHIDSSSSPTDRLDVALALFTLAVGLLRSKSLWAQLSKQVKAEDQAADSVQDQLKHNLHQILETIRSLRPYGQDMTNAARKCMTAILELLPLSQLVVLLPDLLTEIEQRDPDLKPEALYVLVSQMRGKVPSHAKTAETALSYMSDLAAILETTDNDKLRAAAIACIDKITEKYGRKDIEASIKAAAVLAGTAGLAADNSSVQHLSAFTLSSIFDIVGEAAVPLVPETMTNALALIQSSFEDDKENAQLHDAAFTLVSTVVSNVPFMISEEHLDRALTLAAEAAFSDLPTSCVDARKDALSTIARKVDLSNLISSLSRTWEQTIENDIDAVLSSLDMCVQAIEHHSKATVVKSADSIASFIMQVLDLRRVQLSARDEESYSDEEVAEIESTLNDLTLKFIYKINDTVFRPIFEAWLDWAVKSHDLPANDLFSRAQILRQTSLFTLLTHFFGTLQSIVTSYAAYMIESANTVLQSFAESANHKDKIADLSTPDSLLLYTTLLSLLQSTFQHDADSFFTSPSHFQPLTTNILSQLHLAAHKPFRPLISSHIIPTIVALATAVQDTPAHHLSINHMLAQTRRAESAPVRLAGIRTHIHITEEEEVGDEWVNNVVSGIASTFATEVEGKGKGKAGASVGGSGETMIYVNEMLEDDDEDVESEVRRWVRMVRERVGEEVFEF